MVFNDFILNNISVISWRSVLSMEEKRSRENHRTGYSVKRHERGKNDEIRNISVCICDTDIQ
jgi:hypothetical protein